MTKFKTLDDLPDDLHGKRVLVRVDLNVPMDGASVADDTRLRAMLPSVLELADKGALVLLLSHFGRPKGQSRPDMSTAQLVRPLTALTGRSVRFIEDCQGPEAERAIMTMLPGNIGILENTRFHLGEEANDPGLAKGMAALGDYYVNDAFSAAHRAHASTEGVAHFLPSFAGRAMEAELKALEQALGNPERPVAAVVGGAKVSSKLAVLGHLVGKVDHLIIGGGMANTFLKSTGVPVGQSLVEEDRVKDAEALLGKAELQNVRVMLPKDVIIASEFSPDADIQTVGIREMPEDIGHKRSGGGWRILDIGPVTSAEYAEVIRQAKTVVWNGPMGVFEMQPFAGGTLAVAQAVCNATESGATTIVGGGDSVAAIEQMGLSDCVTHISTGGGASLEFLEGVTLPGVAALRDREK